MDGARPDVASAVSPLRAAGLDAAPIAPVIEKLTHDDWKASSPIEAQKRAMAVFAERAPLDAVDLQTAAANVQPDLLVVDVMALGALARGGSQQPPLRDLVALAHGESAGTVQRARRKVPGSLDRAAALCGGHLPRRRRGHTPGDRRRRSRCRRALWARPARSRAPARGQRRRGSTSSPAAVRATPAPSAPAGRNTPRAGPPPTQSRRSGVSQRTSDCPIPFLPADRARGLRRASRTRTASSPPGKSIDCGRLEQTELLPVH